MALGTHLEHEIYDSPGLRQLRRGYVSRAIGGFLYGNRCRMETQTCEYKVECHIRRQLDVSDVAGMNTATGTLRKVGADRLGRK